MLSCWGLWVNGSPRSLSKFQKLTDQCHFEERQKRVTKASAKSERQKRGHPCLSEQKAVGVLTQHYTGLMFLGHEAMGVSDVPVFAMPGMTKFLQLNGPWSRLVRSRGFNIAVEGIRLKL